MVPGNRPAGSDEGVHNMRDAFKAGRVGRRTSTLLAVALVAAACGGNGDENGNGDASGDVDEEPTDEQTADAPDEVIELQLAHVYPEGSPVTEASRAFAEAVEEGTGGSVEIDVFPGGELGGDQELGQSLVDGSLDASFLNYGSSGLDPMVQFHVLPYIVTDYDEADALYYGDGYVAEVTSEALSGLGLEVLDYVENDFRDLTNSSNPVRSPEDLAGLQIRVPELPMFIDLWEEWGAQPIALPFPELYTALQQGTVDGQENGINLTADSNFQEVQDHMTLMKWSYSTSAIIFNGDVWASLSEEQQQVLDEGAAEASQLSRDLMREQTAEKLETLSQDMEITELTAEETAVFEEAGQRIWDEYAETFGEDRIERLRDEVDALRGQ
jgi:tripartite ATP-independent transporter DctP family solute receptor